jgi:hypothetical protein
VSARGLLRLSCEVVRALGPMMVIEISLRTASLPTTCRRLGVGCDLVGVGPPAAAPAVLPRNKRAAVRACLAVVSRWPPGDTCLRRCLLLGHRLRGLQPVLRIGVKRDQNGAFAAHSWLEIGGRTLDPSASEFVALGSHRSLRSR